MEQIIWPLMMAALIAVCNALGTVISCRSDERRQMKANEYARELRAEGYPDAEKRAVALFEVSSPKARTVPHVALTPWARLQRRSDGEAVTGTEVGAARR